MGSSPTLCKVHSLPSHVLYQNSLLSVIKPHFIPIWVLKTVKSPLYHLSNFKSFNLTILFKLFNVVWLLISFDDNGNSFTFKFEVCDRVNCNFFPIMNS